MGLLNSYHIGQSLRDSSRWVASRILRIENGLARIYGTRTALYDGRDSRAYLAKLAELEAKAKQLQRGAWRFEK